MTIRAAASAGSQLLTAVDAMARRRGGGAAQLVRAVAALLESRAAIEETATPIAGLPGLPASEVVLHGVRLFFRTVDGTVWLVGAWRGPGVA